MDNQNQLDTIEEPLPVPEDEMIINDLEILKAVSDPFRLSILELLSEPRTVKEIAPKPPPAPKAKIIRVKNGAPVGGVKKITVKQADTIRFTVSADQAENVHLHGYDIETTLEPGVPSVPSSTLPMREIAPLANRRASAKVVLPLELCPSRATFRSFSATSVG